MKKNIFTKVSVVLLAAFLVLQPFLIFAQEGGPDGGGEGGPDGSQQTQNGFPKLENPLGDSNIGSLQDFVVKAIDAIFKIILPIAALAIIYGGFQMVMASGNEEKLKAAKTQLLYILLGVLIILAAWVIANAIAGTVDSIVKTS